MEDVRAELIRRNARNPRKYLHKFGRGVGFCAEYNTVVNSVVKCLGQGYSFNFETGGNPAGVSAGAGWEDYFESFCPTLRTPLHAFNERKLATSRIYAPLRPVARHCLKWSTSCDAFMFDSISQGKPDSGHLPGLTETDDVPAAQRIVARALWVFSPDTARAVSAAWAAAPFDRIDFGLHVRRGDKMEEFGYVPVSRYIETLEPHRQEGGTIYVATDDATVVGEVQDALGDDFAIYSAGDLQTGPDTNTGSRAGYQQAQFNDLPPHVRRAQVRDLMTEIEILRGARVFIGATTSNVSITVRNLRTGAVIDLTEGAWRHGSGLRRF